MKLNSRLQTILNKIPKCEVFSDIGTDHALLPICVLQKGFCVRAVASDVGRGPSKRAEENVRAYGFGDMISVRTGYGLSTLQLEECHVIVIAGIGGYQIGEILSRDIQKARQAGLIILQPMSDQESARKWLYSNGFEIFEEVLAVDKNKIFNIICCKWTDSHNSVDQFNCFIGEISKFGKDELFTRYIGKKIKQLEQIIEGIEKSELMQTRQKRQSAIEEQEYNWKNILLKVCEINVQQIL